MGKLEGLAYTRAVTESILTLPMKQEKLTERLFVAEDITDVISYLEQVISQTKAIELKGKEDFPSDIRLAIQNARMYCERALQKIEEAKN